MASKLNAFTNAQDLGYTPNHSQAEVRGPVVSGEEFELLPIDESMFASDMTPHEQAVRDLFVQEFLRDRDAYAACLRCGFTKPFATTYARQFMAEPYVRRRIAEATNYIPQSTEERKKHEEALKQQVLEQLIKDAHYKGPGASHAARVSANAKLAAILGMDAPIKTQNENMHRGGVMVVPEIVDIDSWEKAAMKQQEDLMRDAQQDRA